MAVVNDDLEPSRVISSVLCILGPTASGKTRCAVAVARRLDGEIISADSRQVYRTMDVGTGKDLDEYSAGGSTVPHHGIDIVEPGTEYNVYQYQRDFMDAYEGIVSRGHLPVMCGGTGLYLDSIIRGYALADAPVDEALRSDLASRPLEELIRILKNTGTVHNTTDTVDRKRLVRAVEVARARERSRRFAVVREFPPCVVFGIRLPRDVMRQRIRRRLVDRLDEGMVEETRRLLERGVTHERLEAYGLEYRFVSRRLRGLMTAEQMQDALLVAIQRFAARQVRWFRRMERKGVSIEWMDGEQSVDSIAAAICSRWRERV